MKRVVFVCLTFILALTLPIIVDKKGNDNVVFADQQPTEVIVVGEYEKVVQADTMQIDFFVQYQSEDFSSGQEYVANIYSCLCEKLKEIDENICCNVRYMSCKSIVKKENTKYHFEQFYCITSTKLDKTQEIIKVAGKCGISGYNGVKYKLENKQEIFDEILQLALLNANTKANNLISNATLNKVFDNEVFCFEFNNQIIVKAIVKTLYTSQEEITQPDLINRDIIEPSMEF